MEEVFRSTDPVALSFAVAVLAELDIEAVRADVHMSILEGSIGVLPQRLLVLRSDAFIARNALAEAGLTPS